MSCHTKIVVTLGPASNSPEVLETLIRAGVDVVRLNFSHGKSDDHIALAASVRQIAARVGRPVGILVDLQGPKIRVGKFEEGKIVLENGDNFILDAKCEMGNQERVGLDYKDLPRDVSPGNILLLDDVLSELDRRRQDFVLNRISAGQVMITCCEDGISEKLRAGAVFHIQNGEKSAETH